MDLGEACLLAVGVGVTVGILTGAVFILAVVLMEGLDAFKQGMHNRREMRKWKHYCETGEMRG